MIEIKGFDNLMSKFNTINNGEAVDKGLEKGAKVVQTQAKLLARVDTGDLRNSIQTSEVKDHTVEVFTNSDHAVFNEFGTGTKGDPDVAHTTKKSWTYMGPDGNFHTTHGMEPAPFMRPAAEFSRKAVPKIISEEIKKAVNSK